MQNHEFTDVNRFSIRCLVCWQAFVGQVRSDTSHAANVSYRPATR